VATVAARLDAQGAFPDIPRLLELLADRDAQAAPTDAAELGAGRGLVTTDEVRRALLGEDVRGPGPLARRWRHG
jgi:hypothetical protein